MFKVINSTVKESTFDLYAKYPDTMLLLKVEDQADTCGYLLALSDSPSTTVELVNYAESLDKSIEYVYKGVYGQYEHI